MAGCKEGKFSGDGVVLRVVFQLLPVWAGWMAHVTANRGKVGTGFTCHWMDM